MNPQPSSSFRQQLSKLPGTAISGVGVSALRAFAEFVPVPIYACDAAGQVTYFNSTCADLWGFAPALPMPLAELFEAFRTVESRGTPLSLAECPLGTALRENRPSLGQHIAIQRPDGGRRMVMAHASPLHDEAGVLVGAVSVLIDVTQRETEHEAFLKVERQLRESLEATARLHEISVREVDDKGLDRLLQEIVSVAVSLSHSEMGSLQFYDPITRSLQMKASLGLDSEYLQQFDVVRGDEATACAQAIRAGDRLVISNLDHCELFGEGSPFLAQLQRAQAQALILKPLRARDGRNLGVLTVHFRRPTLPPPGVLHNIDILARQAADILDRVHKETELRKSERRHRIFVDHATDSIFLHGLRGVVLDVNARACESLGYTREELIGKYPSFFDPNAEQIIPEQITHRLASGETVTFDSVHRRKDGSEFPVEVRIRPFTLDGEGHGLAFIRDISARKEYEAELLASQQRLELALAATSMSVWEFDPATDIVSWSPANEPLLGSNANEATRAELLQRIEFSHHESLNQMRREAESTGRPQSAEVLFRQSSGAKRWLQIHTAPQRNTEGQAFRFLGTVRDVTDVKLAEQALQQSEERFRLLVESTAEAVWEADARGYFIHDLHQETLDIPARPHKKHRENWLDRVHPDDVSQVLTAWKVSIETGWPFDVEFRSLGSRGEWKWISGHAQPLRNADGSVRCWVGKNRDISDRKLAEEQLALRQAELLHASRLSTVGQMVAALSHEVAQPLSAVANFAGACVQLLNREQQPDLGQLVEYIEEIVRENERCGNILKRLRDFVRQSGPRNDRYDLNTILTESLTLMDGELRRQRVTLNTRLSPVALPCVVDRVQIQQTIVNLMSNAFDAMAHLEPGERILTVVSFARGREAIVEVEDCGHGILPEVSGRLFQPFVTTKDKGMGIGLSICRTIVQAHGGSLDAEPLRNGTRFCLRLPLAADDVAGQRAQVSEVSH